MHSGVALLVNNKIKHKLVDKRAIDGHVLITIEINDNNYFPFPLYISSLYVHPLNARHRTHGFNTTLLDLALSYKYAILVGDLNARHLDIGCKGTNLHGKAFLRYLNTNNNVILNNTNIPTFAHCAHNFTDTLDYALATPSIVPKIKQCIIDKDIGSDHLPLAVQIDNGHRKYKPPAANSLHQNVKLTNWQLYYSELEELIKADSILWPLKNLATHNDTNGYIEKLVQLIQLAINKSTPRHRSTGFSNPRLPPIALALIKNRRNLKRDHLLNPTDQKRKEINELNKAIKSIIKETKQEIETNKASILRQGPKHPKFWTLIKNYLNPVTLNNNPLIVGNHYAGEPHSKLDIFRELYQEILIDKDITNFSDSQQQHMHYRASNLKFEEPQLDQQPHPLLAPVTDNELRTVLAKTQNNKAPGPDTIRYEHIKKAPPITISILTHIYSAIMKQAYFPSHFKTCHVTLIPKPGKDPTQPASYRPITLSPILSKLLEKIIHDRLLKASLSKDIIKPHQTAFLPKRGTENNILRVLQHTSNNFNKNRLTLVVSTDLKQAFDRAWHAGLIDTLGSYTPHNFLLLIRSFLNNRKLFFKIDNTLSSWSLTPNRGMPQGSPLSPLLFNIIMSTAPVINTHNIGTYNYADDTFFTSTALTPRLAWSQIERHVLNFIDWNNKNKLTIQPDKTTIQYLTRRRATPNNLFPKITIQNNVIPRSQSIKILGLTIDPHLTFRQHIKNITNGSHSIINSIRKLMSNYRIIPSYVAILLYKCLIRTKFTYGAPALINIKPTSWRSFETLEHRALRAAYRTGIRTRLTTLYSKSKLTPIKEYYTTISKNTISRIINNENIGLLDIMFRTQPITGKTFTNPPLDTAFDRFPYQEKYILAEKLSDILNKHRNE